MFSLNFVLFFGLACIVGGYILNEFFRYRGWIK